MAIAPKFQGKIALTGHSAGGHLVLRMLDPAVPIPYEIRARITRVMPISPLTDLAPLREVPLNDTLQLTEAEARAESPVHQPAPDVPVHTVVGADERPAFLDQARALTWPGHRLTELPKAHHFNVIDFLEDPDHPLTGWLTNEGAEPPNEPNPSV